MQAIDLTYQNAGEWIGRELGVSDWLEITQDQVDRFAHATYDHDWMHVDPERAAGESPFGGTIAFGFLTLSLITHFTHQIGLWPRDTAYALNYGLNKVRFLAPVPVGRRIRTRFVLKDFAPKANGGHLMTVDATTEIEGGDTPAMAAQFLALYFPKTEAA